jgi:O-antigen ligase
MNRHSLSGTNTPPTVGGTESAPSRPVLLFGWVALAAVLTASLTVPYTDSLGLFGLTLLGLGWGFRDGFVRACTRGERLLLAVFGLVPLAALVSDEIARFTRLAFRFAGRDLRFLLAVAAYGALRRLRPRPWALGVLFAGGAILAFPTALVEVAIRGDLRAAGATGVAIVFGDLAALSGIVGAAGLLLGRAQGGKGWGRGLFALLALGSALGAAVLSDSRGAWLGFAVLGFFLLLALGVRVRRTRRALVVTLVALVLVGGLATGFALRSGLTPARRLAHVVRDLGREARYLGFSHKTKRHWARETCFASPGGLRWLLRAVRVLPSQPGDTGWIHVARVHGLPAVCRRTGGAALTLRVPYGRDVTVFLIPTALLGSGLHTTAFWVRGRLVFRTCWRCPEQTLATRVFREIVVRGRYSRSSTLTFTLRPGARAWVVPVQERAGEFSTAPLRNSVDERFEMWRAAWRIFLRRPWWGVGFGGYASAAHRLARAGLSPPFVAAYEHPHNDVLDAMASGGIVGLVVLLLLYGVPLTLFVRALRDPDPEVRAAGWMGFLVVVGFVVFGLTEAMFVHSLVIGWYALAVGALAAALATARKRT